MILIILDRFTQHAEDRYSTLSVVYRCTYRVQYSKYSTLYMIKEREYSILSIVYAGPLHAAHGGIVTMTVCMLIVISISISIMFIVD